MVSVSLFGVAEQGTATVASVLTRPRRFLAVLTAASPRSSTTLGYPSGVKVVVDSVVRSPAEVAVMARLVSVPVTNEGPNASRAVSADVHGMEMFRSRTVAPL